MIEITFENVEFKLDEPLVSVHEIQATEKQLGFSFPEDYRAFLLSVNGGRLAKNYVVRIDDMDEDVMVGTLYSIGGTCSIVGTMDNILATLPKGFVIFADVPTGLKFLMDLSDAKSCPIYLWEVSNYFRLPEKRKRRGTAFRVADSFTEFLHKFRVFVYDEDRFEADYDGNTNENS